MIRKDGRVCDITLDNEPAPDLSHVPRAQGTVRRAVRAPQHVWLHPHLSTPTNPQFAARLGPQAVARRVQVCLHAAFDAESPQHNLAVEARPRLSVPHAAPCLVDEDRRGLLAVKVVWPADSVADVALEVPGKMIGSFVARAVLREVVSRVHHEGEFVVLPRYGAGVNPAMKEMIR